ncbi:ANL_HP_G0004670.mRNA.1.CDS.1 [Saccharomyces cerevisiae]|nr:ANL_HP_G0195290.mRNA.1.CDS.1 [Saccharomyces cerevisiae]CAI4954490.1 ANL_HP_G0021320.mRNA.1.CDS.1 [Saccharomyces cerevisiae]CAI4959432.1 ANL_HP_G0024910.mRNA.1.CDS.1 [Saccharomyces cerevisiae]CAI5006052.1 ANL_HP_G0059350.mRNA.1.CDS.1 [Saccharomyces cerevisiae]CAI5015907.1 ANL_HP_G0004670.mRNA.1.CDS.1 [Saccharomyces cerevisiae]
MKFFSLADEAEFKSIIISKNKAVDVIGSKLGGQVVSFSDEWFASAENLIQPTAPIRDPTRFVHSGAWYDGWETRRHNEMEYDWVIIKMGVAAAHIIGGEIDTAFFNGNHAPFVSIEALYDEGEEGNIVEDDSRWVEIVEKFECGPSQRHLFVRGNGLTKERFTHIKLKMYPDGGIARFRLYGRVVPPELKTKDHIIDLAYVCNGAVALKYSDQHFGSVDNLLLPGRGHDMSDGWETKRSRQPGHTDWAVIQLGRESSFIEKIIVDTAHFRGNFPQFITVEGCLKESESSENTGEGTWVELVGKSKTGPDKEHVYEIHKSIRVSHVKLTIIPDGGVKRIRVWGY